MLTCKRCRRSFEPGDGDQAVCDNCRDEAPGFADRARMATECEPSLEEMQAAYLEEFEALGPYRADSAFSGLYAGLDDAGEPSRWD